MTISRTILYMGQLPEGSTCLARMRSLQAIGCDVIPFDMRSHIAGASRLSRSIGWRFSGGPAVRALNSNLVALVDDLKRPVDCVWIDKGQWIYPETLQHVRNKTQGVLVHYTPDPAVTFQRTKSRLFIPAIPLYDLLFTTKPFELATYRQLGARDVRLVHQSYDDARLAPRNLSGNERERFGSEVCFIGQHTEYYARVLRAISRAGTRLRIWGPQWRARLWRNGWAKAAFAGDGVWGEDYARALSAADVGLCLLSKRYRETTTTRTFEIPACGTFMLAERTQAHCELFDEGREAEFFGDEQEMIDKLRYYRANPSIRERIAAAGRARCIRDGYGNRLRMHSMLSMALPGAQACAS